MKNNMQQFTFLYFPDLYALSKSYVHNLEIIP